MLNYTFKDLEQAIAGSFVSTLFFFAMRSGDEPEFLSPWVGLLCSSLWFFAIYKSVKKEKGEVHFLANVMVVFLFSVALSMAFRLATFAQIRANPLGSPAMIATWLALPFALLFDKFDVSSVMANYGIKGK